MYYTTASTSQLWDTTAVDYTVTTVPLPAAAWLFLSGIVGLVLIKRKQSHK